MVDGIVALLMFFAMLWAYRPDWFLHPPFPTAPAEISSRLERADEAEKHRLLCALIASKELEISEASKRMWQARHESRNGFAPEGRRREFAERAAESRRAARELQRERLARIRQYNTMGAIHHPKFNGDPESTLPLYLEERFFWGRNGTEC